MPRVLSYFGSAQLSDPSRENLRSGRCLCGNVTFEAWGDPLWVGICHCRSCRRASGGALMAAAGYPRSRVSFRGGSLTSYCSSPGVRRSFCQHCGTSLSYESESWPDDVHLMVGAFDDPDAVKPAFHIFAGEKLSWLCLADNLVRYWKTPGDGDTIAETGDSS